MLCPAHPTGLDYHNFIWRGVQITKLVAIQFSPSLLFLPAHKAQISFSAPYSWTLSLCSSINVRYYKNVQKCSTNSHSSQDLSIIMQKVNMRLFDLPYYFLFLSHYTVLLLLCDFALSTDTCSSHTAQNISFCLFLYCFRLWPSRLWYMVTDIRRNLPWHLHKWKIMSKWLLVIRVNQPTNQSINQSIIQPTNQPTKN
jgi:hypothetical protein